MAESRTCDFRLDPIYCTSNSSSWSSKQRATLTLVSSSNILSNHSSNSYYSLHNISYKNTIHFLNLRKRSEKLYGHRGVYRTATVKRRRAIYFGRPAAYFLIVWGVRLVKNSYFFSPGGVRQKSISQKVHACGKVFSSPLEAKNSAKDSVSCLRPEFSKFGPQMALNNPDAVLDPSTPDLLQSKWHYRRSKTCRTPPDWCGKSRFLRSPDSAAFKMFLRGTEGAAASWVSRKFFLRGKFFNCI